MEKSKVHGLWVPQLEASRFENYAEFEGLPNLDVGKVAACAALSLTFATALDIGAHIGAVSIYLARKFERVVAFEAVPSTFEFLRQNTAELPNTEVHNMAVGPVAGEVYFSHYAKHGQLSHVAGNSEKASTSRIGPIPVCTIDSFNFKDVSFIKIDVEGFELPVLEGALTTLKRCRPLILVEQGGNEELHFGRPRNEASAFLENLGMRMHPDAPRMSKDRLYTF
jgi:FkbM family methyltransferase